MAGTIVVQNKGRIGNPNHDADTGEFKSKDGENPSEIEEAEQKEDVVEEKEEQSSPGEVSLNIDAISSFINDGELDKIEDFEKLQKIPQLSSADDIINHLSEFFSKRFVSKVDELFGKDKYNDYMFKYSFDGGSVRLGIFPCALGKMRYKNNYAQILTSKEFESIMPKIDYIKRLVDYHQKYVYATDLPMQPIVRGISFSSDKAVFDYINNCARMDNDDFIAIYGNGMYGTNIYTTIDYSYGRSYAGSFLIKGYLNTQNAYSMTSRQINNIQNDLTNRGKEFYDIAFAEFSKYISDSNRASKMARSFYNSVVTDNGTCAVMLGLDYMISSNHQRNILNLGRWIIKDDYLSKGGL